ncbi:MAG: CesT family type III secretion system chaperone [Puniceicoccales bacterium]|jgi:hypothetical protein|nr:CesT family type III secretion system chaperone [Puniceicoccales bacterium]
MGLKWEDALDILRDVFPMDGASLEAGVPVAVVHGRVDLSFAKEGTDGFLFLGYMELPTEADTWLQKVLCLNFAYMAEHEESLSWDKEKNKLCVALRLSLREETEDTFYKHMESFITQLEFWSRVVSSVPLSTSTNLFSSYF